jgi:hypothetical protein
LTHRITITVEPDALIIEGAVPVTLFKHIGDAAGEMGLDQIAPGIAQAIGASFVLTCAAGSERLRQQIAQKNRHLDPLRAWLAGCDTGISSRTIVMAICGRHVCEERTPHPPLDPSDFGRCYRLLQAVPELRPQFGKVAEVFPVWAPLVREWGALEALYLEESPRKTAPKLYARMQELLKEGGQR